MSVLSYCLESIVLDASLFIDFGTAISYWKAFNLNKCLSWYTATVLRLTPVDIWTTTYYNDHELITNVLLYQPSNFSEVDTFSFALVKIHYPDPNHKSYHLHKIEFAVSTYLVITTK